MTIEITAITILLRSNSTDTLYLGTTLPNGLWPYSGVAKVSMDVAENTGIDYVKAQFPGIPYEVIKMES